ncbi:MAG: DUF4446 family protein [archaeon]
MFSFNKKGKPIENIEEASKRIKDLELKIEELYSEVGKIKKENEKNIQKFGLLRYNPFNELGGDQSFSLALLDKNNNGVMVSSIFSQEKSRVFGKEIVKGKSKHQLSNEEEEIINQIRSDYGKERKEN